MNDDYVLATLPGEYKKGPFTEDSKQRRTYFELWQGLPSSEDIKTVRSASGKGREGLRLANPSEGYLWVTPRALEALESDPTTLLEASLRVPKGRAKIDAWWVDVLTLEEPYQYLQGEERIPRAIEKVNSLNKKAMEGRL